MEDPEIASVRQFNRALVRRIGVLNESYLRLGRPLGEARLLYEIGGQGAELRALRGGLGLDSGYLSRLLRSLERQGLVALDRTSKDARARRVSLTQAGRRALAAYDRESDAFARTVLDPLTPPERTRLLSAMSEVDRLTSRHAVTVVVVPPDDPDLRRCLDAYFAELSVRFEEGFDLTRYLDRSPDADLRPPLGYAVVARLDGAPVGCGALRAHGDGGEVKRIWTAPTARGRGVARRLMGELERLARDLGLQEIRLGTHRSLTEAQHLYPRLGYAEVEPFDDDPFTHHWYRKALAT